MNIELTLVCGNKKCRKELGITDDKKYVVEVKIDSLDQSLAFMCPYCNFENKIILGKSDQKKFPKIGGISY